MRYLFWILCISSLAQSAQAETWYEHTTATKYQNKEILKLSPTLQVAAESSFTLDSITALDDISVTAYTFAWKDCPQGTPDTEMQLLLAKGAPAGSEVGVQLESCRLSVYVEDKDLFTESLFSDK